MVERLPEQDLKNDRRRNRKKSRVKDALPEPSPPSSPTIELREGMSTFDQDEYMSMKKTDSSGSWRVTCADKVIDVNELIDANELIDTERVCNGIGVLRTRKFYQGEERVLTPWVMYEFHLSLWDSDDSDEVSKVNFMWRTYVICTVIYTGEQGGGSPSAPDEASPPASDMHLEPVSDMLFEPDHEDPIHEHEEFFSCEEVLADSNTNTVIGDSNIPDAQGLCIAEETIQRTPKKPTTCTSLRNMIVSIVLLLALTGKTIPPVSFYMAPALSFKSVPNHPMMLENSKITTTVGLCEPCPCFNDVETNSILSSSSLSCDTQTNTATFLMRATDSPTQAKVHQVFINFRGEELRNNFVSHLADALERHRIKLFIDTYEQRGKDLNNLFVRIEESSIALAIFSTRYPESSWCMDELVKMKERMDLRKLSVIPIFYKVEADDVAKPTGDSEFGKNFWRLAEASSGVQIKKWKEALEGITNKIGLSVRDYSVESDSIKGIVKEVQRVIELIGVDEEESFLEKKT
ncbi:uncharacterized protein LOC17885118 isoform X2 [Capsella rubella]|uniref:uncharacterized protein LOC17885118 isoform X2 n=1 Tax=Capsella rubella TaxID=81985 RepID=UPI000CD5A1CB|nr:uncharacterized protein LOC17885118 isoform X2 [Capsella rubella]